MTDVLPFVILPYAAILLFVVVTVERYRRHGFGWTSRSTQLLENRLHFWALVPFHLGILVVFVGHLMPFLVPRGVLAWNAVPLRWYVLETVTLAGGLLALVGFVIAIARRAGMPAVRGVTSALDWVLYALLLGQLATGVSLAIRYPWGTSWFAAAAAPYLWSLVELRPDITAISQMPFAVKLHMVTAFVLVGIFPFTRLVHILVVPNPYLWRKPQVVRWQR